MGMVGWLGSGEGDSVIGSYLEGKWGLLEGYLDG